MSDPELARMLNDYCREFGNWSRYTGCPQYDPVLRAYMQQYAYELHLRFDFSAQGVEVFVPLSYYSDTGDHHFCTTGWERDLVSNTITVLTGTRFRALAWAYAQTQNESWKEMREPSGATAPTLIHNTSDDEVSLAALLRKRENTPAPIWDILSAIDPEISMEDRAIAWFEQYTNLVLPLLALRLQQGQALYRPEAIFLRLDEQGFPAVCSFADQAEASAGEDSTDLFLSGFCLLINGLGSFNLVKERALIRRLYQSIRAHAGDKRNEELTNLLAQRHINHKGLLFPALTYYRRYPNPLQEVFMSETVLAPKGMAPVFSRYFPKEEVRVSIRPFDLNKDLPLVYGWFHAEHAKPVWKMDWPMDQIEQFYRTILAGDISHSYIGEINGIPTFNLEVYWPTRDVLGDYYEVLPDDYGTHLFIAPTDKKAKFPSLTMQAILDWLFAQPEIGKLVGEGAVESLAALMNKVHVGFRLERIIEMPHKRSHLNFCHREWYWAKFPENKDILSKAAFIKTSDYEPSESI